MVSQLSNMLSLYLKFSTNTCDLAKNFSMLMCPQANYNQSLLSMQESKGGNLIFIFFCLALFSVQLHRAELHVFSSKYPAEMHGTLSDSIHRGSEDTGDVVRVGSTHAVDVDLLNGPSLAVAITLVQEPAPDVGRGLQIVIFT